MHIPAITFEIVTGLSKIDIKISKYSAATGHYLHAQLPVCTS